ncbi:Hypothetical predicted protein [Mytilus galloprovincialis]|uniref:C-type lectin domain-containing protein n=1 Tax=Mytilus galloprovincialis TaxID=29158 RepID=A0A8B6DPS8_MYTGA|nr:Hypothetical predicted protein [Mytilus galloprovincialis]
MYQTKPYLIYCYIYQSFCATRGSQLLTIHDDEENNWICSTVSELSYVSGTLTWTAGIRDPGGDIVWQDTNGAQSSISYSNWSPGEPIGPAGVADCVGVYVSFGKWVDIRCSGIHIVVCKKVKS